MDTPVEFGWIDRPDEVAKHLATMRMPELKGNLPGLDPKKDMFLYDLFKKVTGFEPPKGPQKIGDCVSWGWGNLCNYLQGVQIFNSLKEQNLLTLPDPTDSAFHDMLQARDAVSATYEETATESIYALSRVEVGGEHGSYSDGSVGAWAAKAVTDFGTLSRPGLTRLGLKGDYDPNRAKDWGAKGLPDTLEPTAKQHLVKTTSAVRSFEDAATLIQNGYPVAICSNRGFTMTRDSQGFCKPSGTWNHCMLLCGVRFDRPGCCISQSWGPNTPSGPTDKGQPDNTFWAEDSVINYILSQGDSFTGSQFMVYQAQDLLDWSH